MDIEELRERYEASGDERLYAAAPGDPRGYRFLSAAYLRAGDYDKAATTISAGAPCASRRTRILY
jgi:hypothetical protein